MADRQHGTYAKYVIEKCRCPECRQANTSYEREAKRRRTIEYWHPERSRYVDAEPIRQHLHTLSAQGMGWKRVADAAGVAQSTVYPILYGCYPDRAGAREYRPPRKRVSRTLADKLLAVKVDLADGRHVDSTGTTRRLRALVAIGWSGAKLARALDMLPTNFARLLHSTTVTAATARATRILYDRLWDTPPPEPDAHQRQAASRARNMARRHGWPPPLAWDDDDIDNPDARPAEAVDRANEGTPLEDIELLCDEGYTLAHAAERLGVRAETIQHRLARVGRDDLLARFRRAAQRVA